MALFLAINTSSVTLLPLGVITVRASAGSANPASILIPSLIATICSTTVAIISAKLLAKRDPLRAVIPSASVLPTKNIEKNSEKKVTKNIGSVDVTKVDLHSEEESGFTLHRARGLKWWFGMILVLAFIGGAVYQFANSGILSGELTFFSRTTISAVTEWLIPIILLSILGYGYFKGVELYETVTEGAKEGFTTAVRIIPFMVAIFVAIGLIRASGTLEILNYWLSGVLSIVGMPTEALPMALIRPLSGSGAFGIMSEIVSNNPNSFVADVVSVMQGSTETTFYVLAVYFGSVGISKTRHALPAALLADVTGIVVAVFASRIFLG